MMPMWYRSYNQKLIIRQLLAIGSLALVLRLVYLYLALDNLGMEKLWNYANDTNFYWGIARLFFDEKSFVGSYGLFLVGPGYGLILAGIQVVFGTNPISPILLNILLGTLAPVVIYLLAYQLLGLRPVAFMAGLISAVSWTSISMSCHILTDQPYFTIQAVSILLFVLGLKTGRCKWFLLAGLVGGVAAYIRAIGLAWPLIFLFVAAVMPRRVVFTTRLMSIKRTAITALIIILMAFPWMVRNYAVHDVFTFGSNGGMALCTRLVAQTYAVNKGEYTIMEYREMWEQDEGYISEEMGQGYKKAMARVKEAAVNHPDWMLAAMWNNIEKNIRARNYYVLHQISVGHSVIETINRRFYHWGGYVLLALTLAGLLILAIERKHLALLILGCTYGFYTLITGFSYWQGSRLHYPAEMAWSILVGYVVYAIAKWIRRRLAGT